MITYNEIYELFIVRNLSANEIKEKYGQVYLKAIRYYNLRKTREQRSECRRRTCLMKYGVTNVSKSNKVKQTKKETVLKKYGVENPMQCNIVRESLTKTLLAKYGVDNAMKNKEIKNKQQNTTFERYGYKNALSCPEIRNKCKKTLKQKYGVENPQQNKNIHQKTINTRIEKYGDSRLFGSESFYEKSKETCLYKYNTKFAMQNDLVKQKIIDQLPQSIKKGNNTKRHNKSFNTSKMEDTIYNELIMKFDEVIRQYSSLEYPYSCDFYILRLNLYLEINFHWTHGQEPFTGTAEQLIILNNWKEKANTSKYYRNAIKVWTMLDVEKLNTFKQNNLNYIIFYNIKQFEQWFKSV